MLAGITSRHFLSGVAVDVLDDGKGTSNRVLAVQIIAVDFRDGDVCVLAARRLSTVRG